jgi:hypothetical protein
VKPSLGSTDRLCRLVEHGDPGEDLVALHEVNDGRCGVQGDQIPMQKGANRAKIRHTSVNEG